MYSDPAFEITVVLSLVMVNTLKAAVERGKLLLGRDADGWEARRPPLDSTNEELEAAVGLAIALESELEVSRTCVELDAPSEAITLARRSVERATSEVELVLTTTTADTMMAVVEEALVVVKTEFPPATVDASPELVMSEVKLAPSPATLLDRVPNPPEDAFAGNE